MQKVTEIRKTYKSQIQNKTDSKQENEGKLIISTVHQKKKKKGRKVYYMESVKK